MSLSPDDEENADRPFIEHEPTVYFDPAKETGTEPSGSEIAGAFKYALVFERGLRAGMTYVLADGETKVGRSEDSDLFLGDVSVSRKHALFTVAGDALRVEDLGSLNGTYLNGNRVEESSLAPGDEVWIGKFHFIVAVGHG